MANELTDLAALALFGERRSKSDVYQEISRRLWPEASEIIRRCNRGAHTTIPDAANATAFIKRVVAVAEGLRAL